MAARDDRVVGEGVDRLAGARVLVTRGGAHRPRVALARLQALDVQLHLVAAPVDQLGLPADPGGGGLRARGAVGGGGGDRLDVGLVGRGMVPALGGGRRRQRQHRERHRREDRPAHVLFLLRGSSASDRPGPPHSPSAGDGVLAVAERVQPAKDVHGLGAQRAILAAPVGVGELARAVVEVGVADLAVLRVPRGLELGHLGALLRLLGPAPAQRRAHHEHDDRQHGEDEQEVHATSRPGRVHGRRGPRGPRSRP